MPKLINNINFNKKNKTLKPKLYNFTLFIVKTNAIYKTLITIVKRKKHSTNFAECLKLVFNFFVIKFNMLKV